MPNSVNCCSVGAVPLPAPAMTELAAFARVCNCATVETSLAALPSTTSLSKDALAVPKPVTPTKPYCAALALALLLAALPSAPLKMAE